MENTVLNNLTPTFLNIEIKSFIKTKIKRRERPLIVESSRKFRNTSALLKRLWRESERRGGGFPEVALSVLNLCFKESSYFLTNIKFETYMYLHLHIYIYIYMYLVFFQYLEKIGCYLNRKLKRLKSTQFSKTTCLRVNMYAIL